MRIKKYMYKFLEIYLIAYFILYTGFRYQMAQAGVSAVMSLFLLILAAIWIIYAIREKKKFARPPKWGVYQMFFLAAAVSVVHSVNIGISADELLLWGIALFIFLGIVNIVEYGWNLESLINSTLIVGAIHHGLKLLQAGEMISVKISNCGPNLLNYNKTAAFTNLVLVLALGLFFTKETTKEKIFPGIMALSSLALLWLCHSRGGFVAASAGIAIVLAIQYINKNWRWSYLQTGLVVIALVVFPVVASIVTRPAVCEINEVSASGEVETTTKESSSWTRNITTRYDYWDYAAKLFGQSPVAGKGLNTYGYLAAPEFNYKPSTVHAHSLYFNIAAERGALGLITAAALILTLIYTLLFLVHDATLKSAGLGALATLLIHGIVDVPLHEPYLMRYMAIILGLAVAVAVRDKTGELNHDQGNQSTEDN